MNDMADALKVITQLCHLFLSCLASCPTLSCFFSHFSALVRVSYCTFDSNNDISYHSNTPHNSPIYDEWLADL